MHKINRPPDRAEVIAMLKTASKLRMKQEKLKIKDFTKDELDTIKGMMQTTWSVIGADVLRCQSEIDECTENEVSMPKAHVIESVLDADYMEMYAARNTAEKPVLTKFRRLEYKDQIKVAKQTFLFKRYGY
jgi:hypothetical protein